MRNWRMRAALLFLAAGWLYAWQIEPYRLETTRHELSVGLKSPLRVVLLSDLHTRTFGRLERKILKAVAEAKPDLILIAGDCFRPRGDQAPVRELLSKLKAPLGVLAVNGNWEQNFRLQDERGFFASAGARLLINENATPRADVSVIGLDDPWLGGPNPLKAEQGLPKGTFRIGLFHSPALFNQTAARYPLNLAGHTHGGQVRLPFLPPLWLPPFCGRFVEGWYAKDASKLYVTRGIGTSVLPIRFLARPELAVITLR